MLIYQELGKGISLVRENNDRPNRLNSLLLEDESTSEALLIDSNYPFGFIDELYTRIKPPALAAYYSHCHLDHTAHAFYHLENYGTPIYCPVQEEHYLTSLDALMESIGFKKLGLNEKYVTMVRQYMKFQECEIVNSFTPGAEVIEFGPFKIHTIHIPGHSPGTTAFLIVSKESNESRKILYASDIGSHPYYGDLNSNLKDYRTSINKLEQIYLSDDFILVPAHGTIYLEKEDTFFERIRDKINANETKVLNALSRTRPKTIKELVLERIITRQESIVELIKDLYMLWDGGMIYHHLEDLIEKNLVKKVESKDILTDKYLLV